MTSSSGRVLVIGQACDVEWLTRPWREGDGIGLLLGEQSGAVALVHVQAERVGQAVGHNEGQVLQALQLRHLLVTHLEAYSVVALLQFERVLWPTQRGD